MDRQDSCEWEEKMDLAVKEVKKSHQFYYDNEFKLALEAIGKALSINPADSSWHFCKAFILDSLSQYDEAIEEFKLALDSNPNDLEILNILGINFTRTGQYDLALEVFEQAQKNYQRAISCWLRTAEIDPEHPEINYYLAKAYWLIRHKKGKADIVHFMVRKAEWRE